MKSMHMEHKNSITEIRTHDSNAMSDQYLLSNLLALAGAVCFGLAPVVTFVGLRSTHSLAGGTISVTFTVLLWLALSPLLGDFSGWDIRALLVFALVGLFYPGVVMVLSYESNRLLGPTLTGAAASTAPLFAATAAIMFLGEHLAVQQVIGGAVTVTGLVLLALRAPPMGKTPGWSLTLPITGAFLRGIAQMFAKLGLSFWPSPFMAAFIGYAVSTVVLWGVRWRMAQPKQPAINLEIGWFAAAGLLNGSAVLLTYHALHLGQVGVVSTIVATYPVFTVSFSALFLQAEKLSGRAALSVGIVIAGVVTAVSAQS